ncbi:DUF6694 family lipoprotein [Kosakonia sp.]|uniref:DUF6694 family lipoprotein n=1 Tax=Kosakonia sp. TaxID=1916651 RepID=UPI0028993D85|nr:DUF6694 family lipoprotein [Kosakonia sp.]
MKKFAVAMTFALILSGCDSQPTIDTSSEASMKTSIQKVRESLPEAKRAAYDDALQVIVLSRLNLKDLMQAGANQNTAQLEEKMKGDLTGKTGEEIIAYADKIRKERAAQ